MTHKKITDKLTYFISQNKIPHILFHGPSGSGKRTLVYKFVSDIYKNDRTLIKNYTMFADCAHGKGIKFVREELKFFAKTNVNVQHFKTIVLSNADKLTTDAQSALRRCIELFSHSTRFFIIVENKYSLLKPILSRLCEIYVGGVNLNKLNITVEKRSSNLDKLSSTLEKLSSTLDKLSSTLDKLSSTSPLTNAHIVKTVDKLYEKGYSGLDVMNYIEHKSFILRKKDEMGADAEVDADADAEVDVDAEADALLHKYTLLMRFHKVKSEFRSEKIFMTFILTSLLKNDSFECTF